MASNSSNYTINVKSTGAAQTAADLMADAKAAQALADSMSKVARVASGAKSHWSPAISVAHQHAAALRQQASDAKKSADAQRQAAAAARNAGNVVVDSFAKSDNAAKKFIARLHGVGSALNDLKRQGGAAENLGEARDFAAKGMAAGAVGLAGFGKTALDAGEYNRMRAGLRGQLDPERGKGAGDAFLLQLQDFDRRSPFDLKETLSQAQSAIAQGFKPEELLNQSGTGLFDQLGDAIARGGGTSDNFGAALRQIAQIKSKGGASMQDLNALAEGGKLAIIPTVKAVLGEQRATEVLSGQKKLTSDELFKQVLPAIGQKNKGGMGEAVEGLPGQLANLQSALFLLSQTIGQHVLPVVSILVTSATWLADAIRGTDGPLMKVLVLMGLFGTAAVTFGMGLIFVMAMAGQAALGLQALNASLVQTGVVSGATSASLLTRLVPALLAVGATIGTLIFAAHMLQVMSTNAAKSATMAESTWRQQTGFFISISRFVGDFLDWIDNAIDWVRSKLHLGGQRQFDEQNQRALYKEYVKTETKAGRKVDTYEDWDARQKGNASRFGGRDGGSAAQDAANKASGVSSDAPAMPAGLKELTDAIKTQQAATSAMAGSALPTALSTSSGGSFSGAGDDIRSMQRQLKTMGTGKEFAAQRKALQLQIFDAQTEEGEGAKAEREAKAQRKEASALQIAELNANNASARDAAKAAHDERVAGLKAQYDARKAEIDQQKAMGLFDKTVAKQKREAAKAAFNAAKSAADREYNAQLSSLRRGGILGAADIRAGGDPKHAGFIKQLAALKAGGVNGAGAAMGGGMTGLMGGSGGASPGIGTAGEANIASWLGFAKQDIGGMPKADAFKWIRSQSDNFEKGGFDSEAQMAAYQRAYQSRYGAANFANGGVLNAVRGYSGYNAAGTAGGAPGSNVVSSDLFAAVSPDLSVRRQGNKLIVQILPTTKEVDLQERGFSQTARRFN